MTNRLILIGNSLSFSCGDDIILSTDFIIGGLAHDQEESYMFDRLTVLDS